MEASQSISSVVASLQVPSSSSTLKHSLTLSSDYLPLSCKPTHHRFDPSSFYELATLAAAAFHNTKPSNPQDFSSQTIV